MKSEKAKNTFFYLKKWDTKNKKTEKKNGINGAN